MIYKGVFNLEGTEQQQQIVKEALDAIKFPFEKLKFKNGATTIGWANLNGQADQTNLPKNMEVQLPEGVHMHEGQIIIGEEVEESPHDHASAGPDDHEPLMGRLEGRNYVLGVFYPYNGSVYIDNLLVQHPEYAKTTVSAEIAHSVDEFLPLTNEQRDEIMKLVNGGSDVGLTWWEKVDYSKEYFQLIGESFMILFTYAYSDLPFEGASDFTYHGDPTMGDEVRAIVGIERIDTAQPTPEAPKYVRYGRSKVYHVPTHYKKKTNGIPVTDTTGLKACKVCVKI